MRLHEITMNVQDIVSLPVLNHIPQQRPVSAPLNAQIWALIPALELFGLHEIIQFLQDRIPQTDPGIALIPAVLKAVPQQDTSEADFTRQAQAASVIGHKLGLDAASAYIEQF